MAQTGQEKPYRVDFLGTMSIVVSLVIFMYALTFRAQTDTLFGAVLVLALGVLFASLLVGIKLNYKNLTGLTESLVWAGVASVAIYMVNRQAPFTLDVSPISNRLFAVLMGVAEECFFRLFLCLFVFKVTKSTILALLVSSGTWAVYHTARYGGSGIGAFVIILLAGFVLGYVLLYSRQADGVIFAHGFINFLATSGATVITLELITVSGVDIIGTLLKLLV